MPTLDPTQRVLELREAIRRQGERVAALVAAGVEAIFSTSPDGSARVSAMDEDIDRVDVEIEKACVQLLADASSASGDPAHAARMSAETLRLVLTIVKVNNELERVADVGVSIAELRENAASAPAGPAAAASAGGGTPGGGGGMPDTFRVLANSVVGIVRDACASLDRLDPLRAKRTLMSEETVVRFKNALLRDAQARVAAGTMSAETAFLLHETAALCLVIADHCTNIAEQVLYVCTGKIMRHLQGRWEEIDAPA